VSAPAGYQAIARLAWRDVARHPGRSLLVAVALALPTAELASATVLLRTSDLKASGSFEQANVFMLVFLPTVAAAALTAAAAIAVGARRQLRELGLLAAVGADRRQLGQVVLLQGAGLGLVGGLAGIPLGLAVTWAAFPVMRTWLNPVVDEQGASIVPRFSVIGRDIGWVVAFTVTVALLMSLRPAFGAAKVPVVAALAGRRPPRPARPWLAATGVAVALLGLVLQTAAAYVDSRGVLLPVQVELLFLGTFQGIPSPLVWTLAGVAMLTPATVALAGRAAPQRPAALRLAARDAARHPGRSAPAVAAVAAGLGVLVVLGSLANNPPIASEAWAVYLPSQGIRTPPFPPALRVLLVVFMAMTLAVILAVNALGRAEARDDLGVLDTLGAAPATRRLLAAASAWLLTELGALLGVAAALSVLVAQQAVRVFGPLWRPASLPWAMLVLVVVAVPVVAALAAAAAPARPPRSVDRRPT
jgi:predicted lysophospholipase L1 biosynthesis ABC-type transport system permease subunit